MSVPVETNGIAEIIFHHTKCTSKEIDLFSIHFLIDVLTISISQSTAMVKFMSVWRRGKEMFSWDYFWFIPINKALSNQKII